MSKDVVVLERWKYGSSPRRIVYRPSDNAIVIQFKGCPRGTWRDASELFADIILEYRP